MYLSETGDAVGGLSLEIIVRGLLNLSTSVLDFIMDNPLMSVMFAGSLVGVACYVLRKVKKTAKS